MYTSSILTTIGLFLAAVHAADLNKPALAPNLDNLKPGLMNNLKPVHSTRKKFKAGFIPKDCKSIAQNEGKNPADYNNWVVKYDDVSLRRLQEIKALQLLI